MGWQRNVHVSGAVVPVLRSGGLWPSRLERRISRFPEGSSVVYRRLEIICSRKLGVIFFATSVWPDHAFAGLFKLLPVLRFLLVVMQQTGCCGIDGVLHSVHADCTEEGTSRKSLSVHL